MRGVLSYFAFRGRTNRARYWLTGLALYGLLLLSFVLGSTLAGFPGIGFIGLLLMVVAAGGFLWTTIANSVRRLHDRGLSAWWVLLFLGLPTLLLAPAELLIGSADVGAQATGGLLALLSLPVSIWALVVMGFLRGTVGPNKYGDDPLGEPVLEALA